MRTRSWIGGTGYETNRLIDRRAEPVFDRYLGTRQARNRTI